MKKMFRKALSLLLALTVAFGSLAAVVSIRPASAETEYKTGDTVCYGSYPQSRVSDETMLGVLNGMTHEWKSYNYYSGDGSLWYDSMRPGDFMEYTDVTVLGRTFRGVKISSYRPEHTYMENPPSDDYYGYIYQEYNGFYTGEIYWFEYEPIEWVILDAEKKLLLSKDIIDSQPFSNTLYDEKMIISVSGEYLYSNEYGDIANIYGSSTLNRWAADFYEQFFDDDEKHRIQTTEFECTNELWGTWSYEENVFFLSREDFGNTAYGFNPENRYDDGISYTYVTDYALSQGFNNVYGESWWLRDSGKGSDRAAIAGEYYEYYEDETFPVCRVTATGIGVRPAITLRNYYNVKKVGSFKTGDIVAYGSYPQTRVTDESIIDALNAKDAEWTPYDYYYYGEYYSGDLQTGDCMEYTDVTYHNKEYRGVRISEYRPATTQGADPAENSYQDDNGYYAGNVYWFVYEQLEWIVLNPDEGLILCRSIIDSQPHGIDAPEGGTFLSYDDINNAEYGFYPENRNIDNVSFAEGTDYALSQGLGVTNGKSEWWLRDYGDEPETAYTMPGDTSAEYYERRMESTHIGVRPVINLGSSDELKAPNAFELGDIITFGSYPQSEVTDEAILAQLNSKNHWWHDYNYYYGTGEDNSAAEDSSYMMYADASIGNQKYRGVVFRNYRPDHTEWEPIAEKSYQDDNGYTINYERGAITEARPYWFKYEPLEWIVVDPDNSILLSKTIIDAQPFNNLKYDFPMYVDEWGREIDYAFADENMKYRANRYDISTIREWLNDEFYTTAFNSREIECISGNAYDDYFNGYRSGLGHYHNPTVHDYVSLPSLDNLTLNGNYEDFSNSENYMMNIPLSYSDYALSQGLKIFTEEGLEGKVLWWTRRESSSGPGWVRCVTDEDCSANAHNTTDHVGTGVRPVIKYVPDGNAKKVYRNIYYANGGTFLLNDKAVWSQNVVEGMPVEDIVLPVKDGCRFAGWEDENGNPVEIADTMGETDCRYYAVWEDASDLQSDETLGIEIKLYRYDDAAEEWIETDKAAPSEPLKARVFVDTSYYTNAGQILLFYNSYSGFYSVTGLAANPDPNSFAAKNGLVCTQGTFPKYDQCSTVMLDAGIITEWYDDRFNYIIVEYSFDTDENRKISGDDWLFELDVKVNGTSSGASIEIPENTVRNPFTNTALVTDVPVGVEGGTAADNISLADINVKKELVAGNIISSSSVTFDANGGIMPKNSQEIYVRRAGIGDEIAAVDPPVKDGDEFVGWVDENGKATDVPATIPYYDTVLTAQWASEVKKVTYYFAKGAEPYDVETYAVGETINYIIPESIPEGMLFKGWADADGNPLPQTMGEQNIDAYAVWEIAEHTVTFDTQGGREIEPVSANYGELVEMPDYPVKTGYTFDGWYFEDGTPVEFPFEMPDNDVVIRAEWIVYQYTINFDSQGGTEVEPITADYNMQIDAPEAPEKVGYDFVGWSYLRDDYYQSAMAEFPIVMPVEGVTLYAVWEPEEYKVTYNIGEESIAYSVDFDSEIPQPDMSAYEGKELICWLDSDGNETEIPAKMPANNLEYTAKLRHIEVCKEFDVTAAYDEDCFAEKASLSVTAISGESKLGHIYSVGSTSYRQVGLFNIKMLNDKSEVVQPQNGKKVTVKFPIPTGYTAKNDFVITHWLTEGGRERFLTEDNTARIENGYIIIQVGEFSEFSIHVKSMARITKKPAKTSYFYREELDLSGIELTIDKADGTTRKITDVSKLNVSGYDPKKIGEQTVTVDYNGERANFTVTVSYAWWQQVIRILFLGFLWY